MSASPPTVDPRPVSMVAIIGNDAVLAAAPATPVQIAHACLRRGFAVAVPASWGDELIAAEAMRRLASRERGPAVMCVCPFVRSRLLAPGPDLAPFLVSLVSPPVATARYLRAAYGEHGVHITYIGGCPGADDPSIDRRLTPDAFLADLAEQGIALAEQPLVFDSIVPPDRRRWCSLPGGTPTAEILWGESDMRTLVEIDRDDVSTDLAQHIITRDHVLLDLAPGLGCACSGAIGSMPSRNARAAVTTLEPPRALKPIIDPAHMVSLDAPVAEHDASSSLFLVSQTATTADVFASGVPIVDVSMESRLDELLGSPTDRPWTDSDAMAEIEIDFTVESAVLGGAPVGAMNPESTIPTSAPHVPVESASPRNEVADAVNEHAVVPPSLPEADTAALSTDCTPDSSAEPTALVPAERSTVRRRTPVPIPVRYPASVIPRATASDGKALPRAYVAKRRTPSGGIPPIDEASDPMEPETPDQSRNKTAHNEAAQATPPTSPASVTGIEPVAQASAASEPSPPAEPTVPAAEQSAPSAMADQSETGKPTTAPPGTPSSDSPRATTGADQSPRSESSAVGGAATAPDTSPGPLVALLVALLALGFFVLGALK